MRYGWIMDIQVREYAMNHFLLVNEHIIAHMNFCWSGTQLWPRSLSLSDILKDEEWYWYEGNNWGENYSRIDIHTIYIS